MLVRRRILAAVFAAGVSSVVTQLAVMREMPGAFAGNELVMGVVLGNWLLLTGLGAWLGRWTDRVRSPGRALVVLLVTTALVPPGQIALLRGFRLWLGLGGVAMGVWETVAGSFLLLLPYCLPLGLLLTLGCAAVPGPNRVQAAGWVYALDSLGSVGGGIMFSVLLVRWLDHITLLCVPAILNLAVAAWLLAAERGGRGGTAREKPPPPPPRTSVSSVMLSRLTSVATRSLGSRPAGGFALLTLLSLGIATAAWLLLGHPDETTTSWQWPGQRLLSRHRSPYGRLIVTDSGGQTNFIANGALLASTPNLEAAEETVHFAMAQRPRAQRVLLIGGALSGAAREVLRHPVTQVDSVELDPLVLAVGRQYLAGEFGDPRRRVFAQDARQFVRHTDATCDLVIIALPDPGTAQLNRFFTREFFVEVRRVLTPAGVLSFAVGRYDNYAGPELAGLLSCARRTAAAAFSNVVLIPAGRVCFLASDGPLTTDIAPALERSRVETSWVNRHYLAATVTPDRLAGVAGAAQAAAPVNRDLAPVLYYLHLRHWASQFETRWGWITGGLALVAAVAVWRLRGAAGAVFASGFAGASLVVVLLLALQVLAGSLYQQVAVVVTSYMAGLAAGAMGAMRWLDGVAIRAARLSRLTPAAAPPAAAEVSPLCQAEPTDVGGYGVKERHRVPAGLLVLVALVTVFALVLPAALEASDVLARHRLGAMAVPGGIALLAFVLAVVVGAQFPVANQIEAGLRHPATRLYAADFLGASGGALVTSALLLPVIGVGGVCVVVAVVNVVAGGFIWCRGETR